MFTNDFIKTNILIYGHHLLLAVTVTVVFPICCHYSETSGFVSPVRSNMNINNGDSSALFYYSLRQFRL